MDMFWSIVWTIAQLAVGFIVICLALLAVAATVLLMIDLYLEYVNPYVEKPKFKETATSYTPKFSWDCTEHCNGCVNRRVSSIGQPYCIYTGSCPVKEELNNVR